MSAFVTVVETRTITRANVNNTESTFGAADTFRTGPFDHQGFAMLPVAVIFVYKSSICALRLQRAIELVLDYYPHLTGRLHVNPTDHSWEVNQIGAGASLVVARCGRELSSFSSGRMTTNDLPDQSRALFTPFAFNANGWYDKPLFSVQHTRFSCGATSLGIKAPHFTCDATGFMQLVQHLAEFYRALNPSLSSSSSNATPRLANPPEITPYLSPSEVEKMTEEEKKEALAFQPTLFRLADDEGEFNPPLGTSRLLHFTSKELEDLKAFASPSSSGATSNWISTFDAITALLYQRIYQARLKYLSSTSSLPSTRPESMAAPDYLTSFNLRGKIPGLPRNYFPNAIICPITAASHDLLAFGSLSQVASYMHNLLRSPLLTNDQIVKTLRWMAVQPDKRRIEPTLEFTNGTLMTSQWNKFDLYGTDFEGKPVLASMPTPALLHDGLAFLLPTETPGDMDIMMSVDERVWKILETDELMNRFSSAWANVHATSSTK